MSPLDSHSCRFLCHWQSSSLRDRPHMPHDGGGLTVHQVYATWERVQKQRILTKVSCLSYSLRSSTNLCLTHSERSKFGGVREVRKRSHRSTVLSVKKYNVISLSYGSCSRGRVYLHNKQCFALQINKYHAKMACMWLPSHLSCHHKT